MIVAKSCSHRYFQLHLGHLDIFTPEAQKSAGLEVPVWSPLTNGDVQESPSVVLRVLPCRNGEAKSKWQNTVTAFGVVSGAGTGMQRSCVHQLGMAGMEQRAACSSITASTALEDCCFPLQLRPKTGKGQSRGTDWIPLWGILLEMGAALAF